jgi:hypothetical protein
MSDPAELLRRHQPRLYFDSNEVFFADSAAMWTDCPGNVLKRAGGATLASAGGSPLLSLNFLARGMYGDGRTQVQETDTISDPTRDYRAQAVRLHQNRAYANRIYGHAVHDDDGALWLQYWFFYFYNDYAFAGFGLHEGDWEMIQLRLGADEAPDLAVYAQHKHAGQRSWDKVEKAKDNPDQPIVYVARGSHASYFDNKHPHWTGVWFDRCDGKRHDSLQTLEILQDNSPGWICWPGFWGDTRKLGKDDPANQDSPQGPNMHDQWTKPKSLIEKADEKAAQDKGPPPTPPGLPTSLVLRRDSGHLSLDYALAPANGQPAAKTIVVTINSRDDAVPPGTFVFKPESPAGTIELDRRQVPDDQRADVNVSVADDRGVSTAAVELDLDAGAMQAAFGA